MPCLGCSGSIIGLPPPQFPLHWHQQHHTQRILLLLLCHIQVLASPILPPCSVILNYYYTLQQNISCFSRFFYHCRIHDWSLTFHWFDPPSFYLRLYWCRLFTSSFSPSFLFGGWWPVEGHIQFLCQSLGGITWFPWCWPSYWLPELGSHWKLQFCSGFTVTFHPTPIFVSHYHLSSTPGVLDRSLSAPNLWCCNPLWIPIDGCLPTRIHLSQFILILLFHFRLRHLHHPPLIATINHLFHHFLLLICLLHPILHTPTSDDEYSFVLYAFASCLSSPTNIPPFIPSSMSFSDHGSNYWPQTSNLSAFSPIHSTLPRWI